MRSHAKASSVGSIRRQAKGLGCLFLAALFALLVLIPASASAVSTRLQLGFSPITGSGIGVGLLAPSGIAVDETNGNVFLNDGGSANVTDIFGAEGGVPAGVASPYQISGFAFSNEPSGAAVDNSATSPSKGTLYVVDVRHNTVKRFVRNGGTETYEAAGELTPSSGPVFAEPLGATVDSKGNVFVADYGSSSVVEFGPTGTQLARINVSATVGRPSSVALDNAGDLFVQGYGSGSVYKYPANGSGEVEEGVFTVVAPSGATGVAVDSSTNLLFVSFGGHVTQYDAATLAQQLEFGAGALGSAERIAVDSATDRIYISDRGKADIAVFGAETKVPGVTADATTGISGTKATLNATVNPDGLAVTECKFEYGTTTSNGVPIYGNTKPCEGAIPADSSDHPVSTTLTGLASGSTYHFRVVVNSASGGNQTSDQTFDTPEVVFTEAATAVTGAGATLNGSVSPEGLAVTECKFEYGISDSYGSTTPCAESSADIGTGTSPVPVHAEISGLNGGTTYHFRLIVVNSEGAAKGGDLSFTTLGPLISAQLAEAVGTADATLSARINPKGEETTYHVEYGTSASYGQSSPESAPIGFEGDESEHTVSVHIGGLEPGTAYHFRFVAASVGGSAKGSDVSFATYSSTTSSFGPCPNDQFRTGFGVQLPDCRAYEQGTPIDKHGSNAQGKIARVGVSASGDRFTFFANGGLSVTGGLSSLIPFVASRGPDGWSTDGLLPPTRPGFIGQMAGMNEDLSATLVNGEGPGGVGRQLFLRDSDTAAFQPGPVGSEFGATIGSFAADPAHLTFLSESQLLPGAVAGKSNLYELDHGALTLADRIPAGSATSCDDEAGPACLVSSEGVSRAGLVRPALSRDGSRVFFAVSGPGKPSDAGRLYVREDGARTIWISASQRTTPDSGGEKPATFAGITPDGSKAFFLSCEKLTDDSTAVSTGANSCDNGSLDTPTQGQDLYSYEVDTGELTDLTVDSQGNPRGAAVKGLVGISDDGSYAYFVAEGGLLPGTSQEQCTFFGQSFCKLYVYHDGVTKYVASLAGKDEADWRLVDLGEDAARVAVDGSAVLFRSMRSLTGYDNQSLGCAHFEGKPCSEFFRYSFPDEEIVCVSCLPTGTPPSRSAQFGTGGDFFSKETGETAEPRNLSADGNRAFFESPDALVPGDTDGVADVYEWEAKGTGSCESESQNGGCIYLISSGTSPEPAQFLGASRNGDHVFFFTEQQLVPSDKDHLFDVYDAGVGAGLAAQHTLAPPSCASTACQANPAPPPDPSLASAAYSGAGNVHRAAKGRKCPKGKRKVRRGSKVSCQRAHKQHKRHTNRGGSK